MCTDFRAEFLCIPKADITFRYKLMNESRLLWKPRFFYNKDDIPVSLFPATIKMAHEEILGFLKECF